ncbi:thiamine pyrophosphate-binding protein [Clostridium sp. AM58-1XD]|uniref:thiamine pyrophosphate-binding protein n=1 Tax=Clostridium sp. AM58-1XD TaxID=2292307 RepID=UPI000E53E31C|nr:thiamine pyrophosphate-binding protein [Clostridium sp. AM58-1XD]RGY94786.1 thiamine pyrophosphate-binding protein [Clostridium sp. AM58-1XD]
MNVAEYIVEILANNGVKHVFGYQGGNITYMIDAVAGNNQVSYVQTYHEQGAAFAANAYAQVSRKFGVALSSSGPGAINLINGIANAYYDSIPCLFITGNINTKMMRSSESIRQNGFQESDIVSMVGGITKYAVTIYHPQEVPVILKKALKAMKEGRKGPVLLDIPHNIQREEIDVSFDLKEEGTASKRICTDILRNVSNYMENASKPVLLLGNGSRDSASLRLIHEFLCKLPIPAVVSLCGKDALPNDHLCYRGMIGAYGLPYSNKILTEADFVLVLGSRLDERQRTVEPEVFLKNAKVIHVDIDKNELYHVKKNEICVEATVEQFLTQFLEYGVPDNRYDEWLKLTKNWMKDNVPEEVLVYGSTFRDKLKRVLGTYIKDSIVCVDVGNHQMAAAQTLEIGEGTRYLNSSGLGSMGYALPATIGSYYASENKKLVCIVGDGGFMMNLQELQVIKREKIPVVIIVINNYGLGMIQDYHKIAFEGRFVGSKWGYEAADFKKAAAAFDIDYYNYEDIVNGKLKENSRPVLIEIEV